MIKGDTAWYLFSTGWGISEWTSPDRKVWRSLPPVFPKPPAWTRAAIPGFKGHFWAPDISFANGLYYLYYAVSAFGKNTSAIGLATAPGPEGPWTDKGMIIQSIPGRDLWNAIDPNLAVDEKGMPWLAFGSFWNGIKLVRLEPDRSALATPQEWYTIAARPRDPDLDDSLPGNGAIEAPFIFRKGKFFYLFVSWDYCCRAEKSTYKMVVGRSKTIFGPYLDKAGKPMTLGGGTLVLEGDSSWYGVGHNAVITDQGSDWIVFHGYDAHDKGKAKLRQEKLGWVEDWPVVVKQ